MLNYLAAGLLGLLFATFAKANSLQKYFESVKQPFVWKKFFEKEAIGIAMSITFILLMAITAKEWMDIKPYVTKFVTITFALGGAIGSYVFLLFLGGSKKYIRGVIKSKLADNDPEQKTEEL